MVEEDPGIKDIEATITRSIIERRRRRFSPEIELEVNEDIKKILDIIGEIAALPAKTGFDKILIEIDEDDLAILTELASYLTSNLPEELKKRGEIYVRTRYGPPVTIIFNLPFFSKKIVFSPTTHDTVSIIIAHEENEKKTILISPSSVIQRIIMSTRPPIILLKTPSTNIPGIDFARVSFSIKQKLIKNITSDVELPLPLIEYYDYQILKYVLNTMRNIEDEAIALKIIKSYVKTSLLKLEFKGILPIDPRTFVEWDEYIFPSPRVKNMIEDYFILPLKFFVREQVPLKKHLVLVGIRGVGKTTLLTAIADNLVIPITRIFLPGVLSKWVGESGDNIRKILDYLKNRICLLVIEGFESLLTTVGESSTTAIQDVIMSLFTYITDYSFKPIVAFVFHDLRRFLDTIKRYPMINEGVMIVIPPPSVIQRYMLINYFSRKYKIELTDKEKVLIATNTIGYTIQNILNTLLLFKALVNKYGNTYRARILNEILSYGKYQRSTSQLKLYYEVTKHVPIDDDYRKEILEVVEIIRRVSMKYKEEIAEARRSISEQIEKTIDTSEKAAQIMREKLEKYLREQELLKQIRSKTSIS